jgi:hypothetical protein
MSPVPSAGDALAGVPAPLEAELMRDARAFAQNTGLDPTRVLNLLERAAALQDQRGRDLHFIVFDLVKAASRELPASKVLHVLEREDLLKLLVRLGLLETLASEQTPLYTLEELANVLKEFRGFLDENKESLLQTGYPGAAFSSSPWLDRYLGKLYYLEVRPPQTPQPGSRPSGREFDKWSFRQFTGRRLHDEKTGSLEIDPEDVARLVEGRPKLLKLKHDVLLRVEMALRDGSFEGAWKDCVAALNRSLTGGEAGFYLREDRFYRDEDAQRVGLVPIAHTLISSTLPGGLSDLLEVVGHCECELRFRMYDQTKRDLLALASKTGLSDWRELVADSYLVLVDKPWRRGLDLILDRFMALGLTSATSDFWPEYRARLKDLFAGEWNWRPDDWPARKELIEGLLERMGREREHRAGADASGRPRAGRPDADGVGAPPAANQFRRDAETWSIRFRGTLLPALPDFNGFHYLACLLRRAGKAVDVFEVVRAVHPLDPGAPTLSEQATVEAGLTEADFRDTGPVIDARSRKDYLRTIEHLEARIEEARNAHDIDLTETLEEQLKAIRAHLRAAQGRGGALRHSGDVGHKAADNVRKSVRHALKKIREHDAALYEHLKASVRIGRTCRYEPDPPLDWDV